MLHVEALLYVRPLFTKLWLSFHLYLIYVIFHLYFLRNKTNTYIVPACKTHKCIKDIHVSTLEWVIVILWCEINCFEWFPVGQTAGDISSIFPDIQQQFSKEVEDEANSYFQRIYNQPPTPTMSIDEVLDMLKRFKDSPDKKEKVRVYRVTQFSGFFSVLLDWGRGL